MAHYIAEEHTVNTYRILEVTEVKVDTGIHLDKVEVSRVYVGGKVTKKNISNVANVIANSLNTMATTSIMSC